MDGPVPVSGHPHEAPLPPVDLAPYRGADTVRSVWQLATSFLLFALTWVLMYLLLPVSVVLTLLLSVPAAFFLVRLFIIQHDCGHGSFFRSARTANVVGGILGVLTLTPYSYWKKTHAMHHAGSGNLEHRGFGDIETKTVEEYERLSWFGRLRYRVYRHPLVLFGIGPAVHFIVRHRLPIIVPRSWKRERRSILLNDLGLAAFVVTMGLTVGWGRFLVVQLPIALLSCSIGVWLFYVQHQFEYTYWEHDERWEYAAAAMHGSSYLRLPKLLQWATGNIGIHHVHHLNPRIPNYRLPRVLAEHPELRQFSPVTLWQSVKCMRLTLWDEAERRLIAFSRLRELRRERAAAMATGS
jgi:omega-6 fatty acid desaturase (delta-12 desaturase)